MNEKQINMIRGKLETGTASKKETKLFLKYVEKIEELIEEASSEDFYGTQGWKHQLGL